MSISTQIKVCNNNDNFSSQLTDYADFNDLVDLKFLPTKTDFAKFEIALLSLKIHLRTDTGTVLKKDLNVLKDNGIGVLKVCLSNLTSENYEDCIYFISPQELDGGFFEPTRLLYFPIFLMQNNVFNVQLRDENDDYVWLTYNEQENINGFIVTCEFHIRPMSLFDVKVLSLDSRNYLDNSRYPNNVPYRFSSLIGAEFHQNEDFTSWEVALESVFISKAMMRMYRFATFLEVTSGDINFFETYSNKRTLELATFKFEFHRIYPASVFRCKNLIFYSVTKRLLDELSINLNFYNGSKNITKVNNNFTDDCFCLVVLLFRRKIHL